MGKNSINILLLSHKFYPDIGGIESITEILATNFTQLGHRVHILTWSLDSTDKRFPFAVIRNPNIFQLFREYTWADLVFENNPCLRMAWPNVFFRRPSVVGLQTWLTQKNAKISWAARFKKLWLKQADQVVACSEAIRLRSWPSALVIGNPYQETIFKLLPNKTDLANFVFVGRLVPDKGADIAIKAIAKILSLVSETQISPGNISLTIIGDGSEMSHLQNLVSVLKVGDFVKFTGALRGEELVNRLNQHRFILVPSSWEEPFGIVALEGMACGCLPIVSNAGGLPDAVGEAGITFKRGDVDDLVASIQKLLNNPSFENKIREAAPRHLISHKQLVISSKYIDIFKSILN